MIEEKVSVLPLVKIRSYETTDFAALSHLVAEFFTVQRGFNESGPYTPEEAATMIPTDMIRDESYILVAEPEEGGDIIGFCRYELHEGAYFLRELHVTENWRLRGVGTELLHEAEVEVRKIGQNNLYLSVVPRNTIALRFFIKRGYDIINTVELRSGLPDDKVQRKSVFFVGMQFRY